MEGKDGSGEIGNRLVNGWRGRTDEETFSPWETESFPSIPCFTNW